MAATTTTLADVLKEFYQGPVIEQLNNEVFILNELEKAKLEWTGRQAIFPLHTSRNSGVDWVGVNNQLPTASQQGYNRLVVTAQKIAGRFEIEDEAVEAAKKGSGSFLDGLKSEMEGLVKDVKDNLNRRFVSGGTCAGFLSESFVTVGAGTRAWQFDGDFSKLDAALTAGGGTITVTLHRMDTNAATGYSNIQGAGVTVACTATQQAAGTITLNHVDSALAQVDTTNVALGRAVAVVIDGPAAATTPLGEEMTGIYGNLALPTHFGVNRDEALGSPVPTLHSTVLTVDPSNTPAARTQVNIQRLQRVFDEISQLCDDEPDMILMSPLQRSLYVATLIGTTAAAPVPARIEISGEKPTAGDGGFKMGGLGFNGLPLRTSRHVDNGLMIFLKRDSWKVAELSALKFLEHGGDILHQVSGELGHEGAVRWYGNLVCCKPRANAILVGLAIN
jgi:hypothetical protein